MRVDDVFWVLCEDHSCLAVHELVNHVFGLLATLFQNLIEKTQNDVLQVLTLLEYVVYDPGTNCLEYRIDLFE